MTLTALIKVALTKSLKPFVFESLYGLDLVQDTNGHEGSCGLYVHIPFCRRLCSFCPYCKINYDREKARLYTRALLKEITLACACAGRKQKAGSLYFGGGTPALLIDDLKTIITTLRQNFIIGDEIGIELHPDDIDRTLLSRLKEAGFNMVSIGIQSFNRRCLEKLQRKENGLTEKVALVREFAFNTVDVDLIFAIPGQTAELLIGDVDKAFRLGATQVSTYPLIQFSTGNEIPRPLPEKEKKKMLNALSAYGSTNNLERTSIWTFNKPGSKKYSSVTRERFLGFGLSAASLLEGRFSINTFSLDAYLQKIDNNLLPTALVASLTPREQAAYQLFWASYALQISDAHFAINTGTPLTAMFGFELSLAEKLGLLTKEREGYNLTEKGAYCFHLLEQAYTHAYIKKLWGEMEKEAFPGKIVLR